MVGSGLSGGGLLFFEDKERATGLVHLVLCLVFTRPRQVFLSHWVFVLPVQWRYSLTAVDTQPDTSIKRIKPLFPRFGAAPPSPMGKLSVGNA